MKITDVVFDYYGTLVAFSEESVREGERQAFDYLHSHNYPIEFADFQKKLFDAYLELYEEAQAEHHEYRIDEVVHRFMKNVFNENVSDEFAATLARIHIDEWNSGVRFFDGMHDFIKELAAKFRLSIISNTHCPQIIRRNNDHMGIGGYFAQVVTSIEHGRRKPHRSIFEHALSRLGARPENAVYVGDTFRDDYQAAKAVGMNSFWIDKKNERPDFEERISHVFDLRQKLKFG